jgi:myo-inositol-1(or 4)-monophosphatase
VDSPNERTAQRPSISSDGVLDLFARITDDVAALLLANTQWGESGVRDGQYAVDLDADALCVRPLLDAGFSVLSEESGVQHPDVPSSLGTVVVDPLDGSTNASLLLPWCATALCLVVDGEPMVSMVTNLVTGERYSAVRNQGADRDRRPILVAETCALGDAILAINGLPASHWGWRQFRAMGAAALDICAVGRGAFSGFVDATTDSLGVWDYLASVLIVEEAGGVAIDAFGRDLAILEHDARRTPIVASNSDLLDALSAARNSD